MSMLKIILTLYIYICIGRYVLVHTSVVQNVNWRGRLKGARIPLVFNLQLPLSKSQILIMYCLLQAIDVATGSVMIPV